MPSILRADELLTPPPGTTSGARRVQCGRRVRTSSDPQPEDPPRLAPAAGGPSLNGFVGYCTSPLLLGG